jgi:hypothetical protein
VLLTGLIRLNGNRRNLMEMRKGKKGKTDLAKSSGRHKALIKKMQDKLKKLKEDGPKYMKNMNKGGVAKKGKK